MYLLLQYLNLLYYIDTMPARDLSHAAHARSIDNNEFERWAPKAGRMHKNSNNKAAPNTMWGPNELKSSHNHTKNHK